MSASTNDSTEQLLCGVDIGGTKTEACIILFESLENYKILARERIHTERHLSYEQYLNKLSQLIQKLYQSLPAPFHSKVIECLGLGLPGSVDPNTQKLVKGSIPFLDDQDLRKDIHSKLKLNNIPIQSSFCENDANCFALAETYLGTGKTWAHQNNVPLNELCLIGVTLGTGVGGGLIVNGKIIRGRRGGAGEIGHITLVESGRHCYCGKYGCSEQYLSGSALEFAYASRASAMDKLSSSEIFKRADENDPLAIASIEYYRDHLVNFLSNLSNFLDPHVIVLGGGLSLQKRIYPGISDRLSKGCFLTKNPPAVLQNECGDSAGVLGAALLGLFHGRY